MCGPNALCVDKLDDTHTCICPPSFYTKSSTDTSLSLNCEPNIVLMNCTSTQVQNSTSYKFISLEFVNFQGHDLLPLSSATLNQCETACRNNCSCVGFYYKYSQVSWKALGSQNCFLKAKLLNGYQSPDADRMFIKVSALESAQSDINSSNSMMRPEYSAAFSFLITHVKEDLQSRIKVLVGHLLLELAKLILGQAIGFQPFSLS